jgi:hypothetical protein
LLDPDGKVIMNCLIRKTVNIDRPFRLSNGTRNHPAGDYEITIEEEPLGDMMLQAYRRVSTTIYLPERSGQIGFGEILEIDPRELEHLLQKQALD